MFRSLSILATAARVQKIARAARMDAALAEAERTGRQALCIMGTCNC